MTFQKLGFRNALFSRPQSPQSGPRNAQNHPDPPQAEADPAPTPSRADLIPLTELQPRPIEWLWQDRLASGTLALLSGHPGAGKTWIALAIAAALSRGRAPYGGEPSAPCTVLYASTENIGAEVILPRFGDLDGDPARLVLLRGILPAGSKQPTAFTLRDTPTLEDALLRTRARLLIVDPLHTCLGPARGSERDVLEPLARLAEKHRCCILLVRHLGRRDTGHRGPSAIALSAAVRTELLARIAPDDPAHPSLFLVKSNLGRLAPPLTYEIDPNGKFRWTGLSRLTPEESLADRPLGAGQPKRRFAAEWLREALKDGGRYQYSLEFNAQGDGISPATLRRSKVDLGIISVKEGKPGSWYWTLPPQPTAQGAR